jgi:hypothetical protein
MKGETVVNIYYKLWCPWRTPSLIPIDWQTESDWDCKTVQGVKHFSFVLLQTTFFMNAMILTLGCCFYSFLSSLPWKLDFATATVNRERRFRALVLQNHPKRRNVRFKKYCRNFDARRRIQRIRANEALAPSSLVPQIIPSCG